MADIVSARDDQSQARARGPAFAPDRDLFIWVAVFDHTQTRHTRHPRAVRLSVEP